MTTKFELFFERIKKASGCSTDTGLAQFLEINKSTLSMWKKREKVDYELLFTKFEHLEVDYNWLIKGENAINEAAESPASYQAKFAESIKREGPDTDYKIDVISSILGKLYFQIAEMEEDIKDLKTSIHHKDQA